MKSQAWTRWMIGCLTVLLLVVSCVDTRGSGPTGLDQLDGFRSRRPDLVPLVVPRTDGFARADEADARESGKDSRIVSAGWRAVREKRFDTLGVIVPDEASGQVDVGVSRFETTRFGIALDGARAASLAQLDRGRVFYPGALDSTDRVLVSDEAHLEELLVLRDAKAPRQFSWTFVVPAHATRVTRSGTAMSFEDEQGRALLSMKPPRAFEATGEAVGVDAQWNDAEHRLTISLVPNARPLAYPIVLDPEYETDTWQSNGARNPMSRTRASMAFDAARGELVVFGGLLLSGQGTDETWIWNGVRWRQRFPLVSPPARFDGGMVFDSARSEVVLFGGNANGGGDLSDTWVWNGTTWTQRAPATSPPSRSTVTLAYDAARRESVLFGGKTRLSTLLADTWVWDGTTWTQRTTATSPSARSEHVLVYDPVRAETILFGGSTLASGIASDTWAWNGVAWTLRTPATSPSARYQHGASFDGERGELVLFGGRTLSTLLNDTWVWNGATWALRTPTTAPTGRVLQSMAYDAVRKAVVMLSNGETWTWDGVIWNRAVLTTAPPSRSLHAMAFDSVRNETILFGGANATSAFGDTWAWNGVVWTQRTPSTSPSARAMHAMAFDESRGELILFGGYASLAFLADTWAWNGTTWALRSPASSPPPRRNHALAFDRARGEIVLFGGDGGTLIRGDTWVWNGTTWTARAPSVSPSVRYSHALAFDALRSEVVLFGGLGGGLLGDTWVWNGVNWDPRPAATAPAHYAHAMAPDALPGYLVAFGGTSLTGNGNDTWIWNGATWTQRFQASAPSGRTGHAMALDAARKDVVLFGGLGAGSTMLNDTWLHRTLGGGCSTELDCLDGTFCVDGVCCASSSCGACRSCAGTSPGRCAPVTNEDDPDTCGARDGKSCDHLGDCKAALGVSPSNATDCASGHFADGVCCDEACTGACQACRADLKASGDRSGKCGAVREGIDPHDDCVAADPTTCGLDGTCDGRGGCRRYVRGAACGPATCVDNRATARLCDGLGTCGASAEGVACGAYVCVEPDGCATVCVGNDACAPLHHCEAGRCIADRGAACDGDHTVVSPEGGHNDCSPYRCEGATCRTTCARKTDCTNDADCSADGRCTPFVLPSEASPGGCRAAVAEPRGAAPIGFACLMALAGVRRRRRSPSLMSR